jgi:hypothetical protein
LEDEMAKGIRTSFRSVCTYAGVAIAAIAAVMLVDFSPAAPRQNAPVTKQAVTGLTRTGKQAARPNASSTNRLVANYGELPLGFEPNEGQTDGRVKFLSRGRWYSLFLTGNEAVLTFHRKAAGDAPAFKSADARAPQHPLFGGTALPGLLSLPKGKQVSAGEALRDRRAGPAGPSSPLARRCEKSAVLRMRLVGANAGAAVMGREELPGKSNYFIGNDPKKWRTNVPTFAEVNYQNVYPGVDLVYYGSQSGQLEYDFVLAPGADPAAIRLGLSGELREGRTQSAAGSGTQIQPTSQPKIQNLVSKIDPSGDLVVKIDGGEVRFHKPVIYQPAIDDAHRTSDLGLRTAVEGHYVLRAGNQVGFEVAPYDHSRPLVIDPVLSYSTFLDSDRYENSSTDNIGGIAVDSLGDAYVTGWTTSTEFPTTTGALESASPGGTVAYVSELDPTGTSLVYSTYLGDAGGSAQGYAIAVDTLGNAYIAGAAEAPFPITAGAYQTTTSSGRGNFVAKLNPAGSALVYSTWFGTGDINNIWMAVNSAGNLFLTGIYFPVSGAGIPTTSGAFQPDLPGCSASVTYNCNTAFVTEFNAAGSALVYSTYLGGTGGTSSANLTDAYGIAADSSGSAYVTGFTGSTDFPTVNPIQATNKSYGAGTSGTAFVTKLNPAGSALVYSTYLGGSNYDGGQGIAVDSSGNAYVTGYTGSTDFPTVNPFQGTCGGCSKGGQNAFVAKLNAAGSALAYSTFLGGSGSDSGSAIAVDSAGEAFVTGETTSTNFPTVNPFQATNQGGYFGVDVFVSELNAAGSALVASSYLGGTQDDYVSGIGVDAGGNSYVAGRTYSSNFPTTPGALQQTGIINCLPFPIGYIPFTSIYTNAPTPPGYVWGQMTPAAFSMIQTSIPLPNALGSEGFCEEPIQLAPGYYAYAAVPYVAERQGDFGSIPTQLTNPVTGTPYPGNMVPPPTSAPGPWLWLINGITVGSSADYVAKISLNSGVSLSSASLPFGTQDVGVPSSALTETVTNSGTDILTIAKATIAGADPGDFATSADTCSGATINPTDSCTVNVTFTPAASGSRTASLEFIDNAANSPQTVALTGTGFSLIAVTLDPPAASVPLHGTRVFTATISGTTNLGLIWSVNGVVNGNAEQGTITRCTTVAPWRCSYSAPVDVPSPNPVVIKVASAADPAIFATAIVTLTDSITVTIVPATASLRLGGRLHLTSILRRTTDTRRSWYVNGILNGNSAQGTLTACTATSCNYVAPSGEVPSPDPVVIKVESVADPTKFGTATIMVTSP